VSRGEISLLVVMERVEVQPEERIVNVRPVHFQDLVSGDAGIAWSSIHFLVFFFFLIFTGFTFIRGNESLLQKYA
jgi:hypothetical protein